MRLVTLDKARLALRYDTGADDLLADALDDASNVVLSYVDSDALTDTSGMIPIDTAGDPDVPLAVQRAVIYLAGIFLRDPAGIDKDDYRDGFIPAPLRALLNPYRTPTMR